MKKLNCTIYYKHMEHTDALFVRMIQMSEHGIEFQKYMDELNTTIDIILDLDPSAEKSIFKFSLVLNIYLPAIRDTMLTGASHLSEVITYVKVLLLY